MSEIIKYQEVESKVIKIRDQSVILDRDVAELYGVETKRVNEAVRNNIDKFPEGYLIDLASEEWDSLRSKFSTLETSGKGQYTKYKPRAFTEKGLYMLATILKSPIATQTTIAIVETFAKLRELARTVGELSDAPDEEHQKALMQKSGDLLADLLDDDVMEVTGDETTVEMNLAFVKIKRTVKREKRK